MVETGFDRRQFIGGGAALLGLAVLPAAARTAFARRDTFGWGPVQAMLDGYVGDGRLPGAVGAVARGTDDACFLVSGTLGRDSARAMDADSLFRVYSMTKPITGIAAMMLVEDGKIGLDQDIADFLPLFRNPRVLIDAAQDLRARPAARPITVRNLLTHTAGLGYTIVTTGPLLEAYRARGLAPYAFSRRSLPGVPDATTAPTLEIFANRLAGLPLIADPGTRWSYSVGLDLMGRVIEVAGGMAFDRFLQSRLFDPLGMTSSFFQVPRAELPRLTTNYGISPKGKFPIDSGRDSIFADPPAFPFGGAGLVMSARDYDRFLLMLAGGGAIGRTRIAKAETVALATSNLMPPAADTQGTFVDGQGFGAGGRVTISARDGLGAGLGTFGWGGAAATIAWVDPMRGVRACGFAQFMPDQAMPFTTDFGKAVYASL